MTELLNILNKNYKILIIGDVVLDCFGGSGSTLLAAERTKRKARIIEYEPKYCDVTIHRFEAETGKTATLMYREENNHAA